jgi:hypothetical protein
MRMFGKIEHMKQIKRTVALTAIVLTLVTGMLGIALVLELVTSVAALELLRKMVMVFGITGCTSILIIAILHYTRD